LKTKYQNIKNDKKYTNEYQIHLYLTDKDYNGNYPLLWACNSNNVDILKLLMDYSFKHKIKLNLKNKDYNGNYRLLWACYKNNLEMVELLM